MTEVDGKRLAEVLGLQSTRRLTDFADLGMPSRGSGKGKRYPLEKCVRWYLRYSVSNAEKKRDPADFAKARARKTEAEAKLAEIELAQAEGRLLPLDEYEKELGAVCERIRSVLMTVPSKYMGRIQIARSDLEAQAVGEQIRDETLVALQGTVSDGD